MVQEIAMNGAVLFEYMGNVWQNESFGRKVRVSRLCILR